MNYCTEEVQMSTRALLEGAIKQIIPRTYHHGEVLGFQEHPIDHGEDHGD